MVMVNASYDVAKRRSFLSTLGRIQLDDLQTPEAIVSGTPATCEVQLLRPGIWQHPKYGTLHITTETQQNFVDNFGAGVRKIDLAIDQEHKPELGAAGWIRKLLNKGDEGLFAVVDWTTEGVRLVRDKIYRYLSAEFDWEWTDEESGQTYKNVLVGAALTNRPFIKGMAPVNLSEYATEVLNDPQATNDEKEVAMKTRELVGYKGRTLKFSDVQAAIRLSVVTTQPTDGLSLIQLPVEIGDQLITIDAYVAPETADIIYQAAGADPNATATMGSNEGLLDTAAEIITNQTEGEPQQGSDLERAPNESEEAYRERVNTVAEARRPDEGMPVTDGEQMQMEQSLQEQEAAAVAQQQAAEQQTQAGAPEQEAPAQAAPEQGVPADAGSAETTAKQDDAESQQEAPAEEAPAEEEPVEKEKEVENSEGSPAGQAKDEEVDLAALELEDTGETSHERRQRLINRERQKRDGTLIKKLVDAEETPEEKAQRLKLKASKSKTSLSGATARPRPVMASEQSIPERKQSVVLNWRPKPWSAKEARISVKLSDPRLDSDTQILLAETQAELASERQRTEIEEVTGLLKHHAAQGKLSPVMFRILHQVLLSEVPQRGFATFKLSERTFDAKGSIKLSVGEKSLREIVDIFLSEMPPVVMLEERSGKPDKAGGERVVLKQPEDAPTPGDVAIGKKIARRVAGGHGKSKGQAKT